MAATRKSGKLRKLTRKQAAFVRELPVDNNATQAAIRAGFSPKTAATQAQQLLQRTYIKAALSEHSHTLVAHSEMQAADVLNELATLARSDIRHYVMDANGQIALAEGAPDIAMRAVASAKMKRRTIAQGDGQPPIIEHELDFRLWNKNEALRDLGKYWRLFVDRLEVTEPLAEEARRLAEQYGLSFDELITEAQAMMAGNAKAPLRLIVGGNS